MLLNTKLLYGTKIDATDGGIGQVKDLYFDDVTLAIRYLVVETGSWLSGRQVLLSPHAFREHVFGRASEVADTHVLHANLTRKQIEGSPWIETCRPVSRQYEEEYFRYYGWPCYWRGGGMFGVTGVPVSVPFAQKILTHHEPGKEGDNHLRSMQAFSGYTIQATDGKFGSVGGFNIDGRTWMFRELVVATSHWYAGKSILILPENINRISYPDSTVFVNLCMEDLRQTTQNDVAQVGAGHR